MLSDISGVLVSVPEEKREELLWKGWRRPGQKTCRAHVIQFVNGTISETVRRI